MSTCPCHESKIGNLARLLANAPQILRAANVNPPTRHRRRGIIPVLKIVQRNLIKLVSRADHKAAPAGAEKDQSLRRRKGTDATAAAGELSRRAEYFHPRGQLPAVERVADLPVDVPPDDDRRSQAFLQPFG